MRNLEALPIEIIQHIAAHLPSITDLLHLSLTSHKFYSTIQATKAIFRDLFLRTYDRPPKCVYYDYKYHYSWRTAILNPFMDSEHRRIETLQAGRMQINFEGSRPLTHHILQGVRTLLFEASSKNFTYLRRFALKSRDLLPSPPADPSDTLRLFLMTLQLVLTNVAATERISWVDTPYERVYSQSCAYGDGQALFTKGGIDAIPLTRLWATANFFLLHFNGCIQGLESRGLKLTFDQLLGEERGAPRAWNSNLWLEPNVEMPKYWFGFYVYLEPEDIHHVRTTPNHMLTLQEDHYDGKLTIMEITTAATTFTGTGTDIDTFTVRGTITPLPPIFSIPGFRRVSFSNDYPDDRWLYEGCLLPGSQTVIGRWTTYDEDEEHDPYSTPWEGPFIMWAVSHEDYEYEKALREDEGKVGEVDDFLNL